MTRKRIGLIAGASAAVLFVSCGVLFGLEKDGNSKLGTAPICETSKEPLAVSKVSTKEEEKKLNGITLHYKWDGEQPHLYYSVDGTNKKTSFPGVPMKEEGNGWYSYTVTDAKKADLIISVPKKDYQTSEFSREKGEYWYSEEGGWSTTEPDNYTEPKEQEVVSEAEAEVATDQKIIVHFPGDWDSASIYYWNILPNDKEVEWPGQSLEKDEDGYYTYTFEATTKANFLFTNGSEQTDDFTQKSGEYWYTGTEWSTKKPGDNPQVTDKPGETTKPTVTVSPSNGGDFRDETIYFLITTRFYDGDPSNNAHCNGDADAGNGDDDPAWRGDFKGLIEKLDYIKALGFSAIWITPVVENRSDYDYHGYHAYDFSKVDSRYESSDTSYQDLINAAHDKGIKIIQDIVLNHTSNYGERNLLDIQGSTWQERKSNIMQGVGDSENIYHHTNQAGSGDYDNYNAQTFTIANDCIDLETENPKVYNYLIDCYNKYINMGVDAFRIDTVKHISRLTFNATFLPAFRKTGGEDFYMFGEVCTKGYNVWYRGNPGISTCFYSWAEDDSWLNKWSTDLSSNEKLVEEHYTYNTSDKQPTSDNAFLEGNTYHTPDYSKYSGMAAIDFQMHWAFKDASSAYDIAKGEDAYFNDSTWNVVYVDSHDYAPDYAQTIRYNEPEDTCAENFSFMFTFRGIPCIYYGSEVQFQKGCPIDEGTRKPLAETGRAYFGDYLEGEVTVSDYGVYSGASGTMKETLENSLATHIRRLNMIRRKVPALCRGQYATCDGGMAYKRRYTDEKNGIDSYALVTVSGDTTFTDVENGTYVELVTGKEVKVTDGTLASKDGIGKANMRVYVLQNATAKAYGATGKIGEDGTYLK